MIVRFRVGTDLETALVRLNQKLQGNFDRIPQGLVCVHVGDRIELAGKRGIRGVLADG